MLILALIGYVIAICALIVAAIPRRKRPGRWFRLFTFSLAMFAVIASSILFVQWGGIALLWVVVIAISFVAAVGVLAWLFAEFVGQLEIMTADRPPPPDADMSFLKSASQQPPDDTKEERVPGVLERMKRPSALERIRKMRFLTRWSFIQRPPE